MPRADCGLTRREPSFSRLLRFVVYFCKPFSDAISFFPSEYSGITTDIFRQLELYAWPCWWIADTSGWYLAAGKTTFAHLIFFEGESKINQRIRAGTEDTQTVKLNGSRFLLENE